MPPLLPPLILLVLICAGAAPDKDYNKDGERWPEQQQTDKLSGQKKIQHSRWKSVDVGKRGRVSLYSHGPVASESSTHGVADEIYNTAFLLAKQKHRHFGHLRLVLTTHVAHVLEGPFEGRRVIKKQVCMFS